jgi:hypothetical protein
MYPLFSVLKQKKNLLNDTPTKFQLVCFQIGVVMKNFEWFFFEFIIFKFDCACDLQKFTISNTWLKG